MPERELLIDIITKYLALTHFKRDKREAMYWMSCSNSNFSHKSPKSLILSGRAVEVWDFIMAREFDEGRG